MTKTKTPLDRLATTREERGVLLSDIKISHIEFKYYDDYGKLECLGFVLENVTPINVDKVIREIQFLIDTFNNPKCAKFVEENKLCRPKK